MFAVSLFENSKKALQGVVPYTSHIGHFGLELDMAFEETTGVYERIYE